MESDHSHQTEPAISSAQAQGSPPPIRRTDSGETERPDYAQHQRISGDNLQDADDEGDSEDEADPAEVIADFDWDDLHQRYHDTINQCIADEQKLMHEWEDLMNFFKIWAEAGHRHETDRTYSRLRTRMAYVQNSEQKLEKTRDHYVNVVKAFESALNLLKANSFPG